MDNNKIQSFENKKVRSIWNVEKEEWFFSVVDVVAILTDSPNPQVYWRVLKKRLSDEGNETVTNCNGLKMQASDGKMRFTDVATNEQLFRLIQSIPSPKAEPFKLWLAKKGGEVALKARKDLERKTGKKAISSLDAKTGIQNLKIRR